MLACCILILVGGLATPGLVNWSMSRGGPAAGLVVAIAGALFVFALFLALTFTPTIIAFREKRRAKKMIAIFNCLVCVFYPDYCTCFGLQTGTDKARGWPKY
jgi:hypothetical protein